jgi:hypothetical protein
MVLIDPSIPDQVALQQKLAPQAGPAADPPMIAIFRKCAAEIRAGNLKPGGPDPDRCMTYPPVWPAAFRQALAEKVSNPLQYEAMASFAGSSAASSKAVVNPARDYRAMPLIVLTATRKPSPPPGVTPPPLTEEQKARMAALDALWDRGHDELAALSSRGINARVPGADHFIQRAKPQVVLDAVAQVVSEVRASGR